MSGEGDPNNIFDQAKLLQAIEFGTAPPWLNKLYGITDDSKQSSFVPEHLLDTASQQAERESQRVPDPAVVEARLAAAGTAPITEAGSSTAAITEADSSSAK